MDSDTNILNRPISFLVPEEGRGFRVSLTYDGYFEITHSPKTPSELSLKQNKTKKTKSVEPLLHIHGPLII